MTHSSSSSESASPPKRTTSSCPANPSPVLPLATLSALARALALALRRRALSRAVVSASSSDESPESELESEFEEEEEEALEREEREETRVEVISEPATSAVTGAGAAAVAILLRVLLYRFKERLAGGELFFDIPRSSWLNFDFSRGASCPPHVVLQQYNYTMGKKGKPSGHHSRKAAAPSGFDPKASRIARLETAEDAEGGDEDECALRLA